MDGRPNANQPMAPPGTVKITAKEFAAKYHTKRECYNFFAVDVGVYLPPFGKRILTRLLTHMFPTYRASHDLLPEGPGPRPEEE